MASDVGIHSAVVLEGEDVLRTVLLIHRPDVDELVEQAILARVDDLLGIVDGLLIVGVLIGLTFLAAGLGPYEIDLG